MKAEYSAWFAAAVGQPAYPWQVQLGEDRQCRDRLIRIPTGMGKTLGVMVAWLWNRVQRQDLEWPRRLVWCLPMRVLVEQTAETAKTVLEKMGTLWRGTEPRDGKVGVHLLMGGVEADEWHLHPEHPAILLGTQDMLLSRALNRGYASGRAKWPMEFGLLNQDCLWVMDEVQLMDVGLATSVQLQCFRNQDAAKGLRPCRTWWMSATLQPSWMETRDSTEHLTDLGRGLVSIPASQRKGALWAAPKPVKLERIPAEEDKTCARMAQAVLQAHADAPPGDWGRITLVVVNRVAEATALYASLVSAVSDQKIAVEVHLVHSRFRGLERRKWPEEFLAKRHCTREANRIIVATQVVEAGVDVSATALVTELAPWPSLVQRFGRAARYGGSAQTLVVDRDLHGDNCLPYSEQELDSARKALAQLKDAGLKHLEELETRLALDDQTLLSKLYPYQPLHMLTRRECDELFDTSADLTGADLDVSRFIRSGEDRDLLTCWADVPENEESPPADLQPLHDGLCPVPFLHARRWLLDKGRLKEGCRAWVWDYSDGRWRKLTERDCYPGRILMVDSRWGGYDAKRGFTGQPAGNAVAPFDVAAGLFSSRNDEYADLAQGFEDESIWPWKTIATHGAETAREAVSLGRNLGIRDEIVGILDLAGRLHDWGKAHPAFRSSIISQGETSPSRRDLAKAPRDAWCSLGDLYCQDEASGPRKGFRHELASALAVLELLAVKAPDHGALLGPYRTLLQGFQFAPPPPDGTQAALDSLIAVELGRLSPSCLNLLAYLVCSHHGKVREALQGTSYDQDFPVNSQHCGSGQPLRGVREGDTLPEVELAAASGATCCVPSVTLHLDPAALGLSSRYGPSWVDRVHDVLGSFGPFALAWMEAILRVADIRASRLDAPDPLLREGGRA